MGSLAENLDSLRLNDGRPDVAGRRVQLDDLKDALSSHEIRRLRSQLNEITMQADICGELPAELLTVVADHLELDDVMKARFVSRRWREVFSTPDFCLGVIKKHFPSVWARDYKALDISGQDAAKLSLSKWLPAAALDRFKKLHGHYSSMSTYHYKYEGVANSSELDIERQYNNGRVAFRTHNYRLITQDLRTGAIAAFLDENRVEIKAWLLSDRYLLSSTVSPNTLRARPIDSSTESGTSYIVRLPSQAIRISARNNQVGILTHGSQIFLWNIGGLMKSVDFSMVHKFYLADFKQSQPAIIFHPAEDGHVFIIHDGKRAGPENNTNESLCVIVQEYVHGDLSAIFNTEVSSISRCTTRNALSGRMITCKIWKTGSTGSKRHKNCRDQQLPYQHTCFENDELESFVTLTFDIWTKKFAFKTYHLPATGIAWQETSQYKLAVDEAFIWNNQALLPAHRSWLQDGRNILVLASHSCDGQAENTRWYGKGSLSGKEKSYTLDDEYPVQVRGDDDFVVLFSSERMVVWCFDKNVQLPTSWSDMDPSVPEALR